MSSQLSYLPLVILADLSRSRNVFCQVQNVIYILDYEPVYVSLLRFVDCQCNNINLAKVNNIIIVWVLLGVWILHVIERHSNHAQTDYITIIFSNYN